MASDETFVKFVLDQASSAGHISARKMFGEYGVWCDAKLVMLVCDNRCFLKPTSATAELTARCPIEPPYPGAKPQPVIDELLDDPALTAELVRLTWDALPAPKPRKPKKSGVRKS